jgi:hypothetical protein
MHDSPRIRRLRNDLRALEQLASESSVFRFSAHGTPPTHYDIVFHGTGLYRDSAKTNKVKTHDTHRVQIKLGSSYPPNISEIGMVCLGGYGTHWVPSIQLDELCVMLWDMARYHNYDGRSPYNREAALWVASQTTYFFPTDARPLRDLRAALGRIDPAQPSAPQAVNGQEKPARFISSGPRALAAHAARVKEFLSKRSNRAFADVAQAPAEPRPNASQTTAPRSSALQDLISAELHSPEHRAEAPPALTPPPAFTATEDFIILDEPDPTPALMATNPMVPAADEIRFIE